MSGEENQLNVQGYNIVTILKRLETATSRLEDITMIQDRAYTSKQNEFTVSHGSIGSGSALAVAAASESVAKQEFPPEPAEEKPKSVVAFEQFISDYLDPLVTSSNSIDPVVGESATALKNAFLEQAKFLDIVSKSKKPEMTDPKFSEAVTPMNEFIGKISEIKDANRKSKSFNHLNTIAEGAPVLGWIVSSTPVSYIPDFKDGAQFWANRILKEYRDKDENQVNWVKQFLGIFEALKDYVKEFHTKGPKWNSDGLPIGDVLSKVTSSKVPPPPPPAPAAGGPPPPPPPPPANLYDDSEKSGDSSSTGMQAVFADLNKGEAITSGLKKVEKSQMTHKNPELRKQAPAVPKKPTPPKKPSSLSSSTSVPTKKPAKKDLVDGSKWIIENYTKADLKGEDFITIEAEMHQSIFIGNCEGIAVQIKGKANAISVSNTSNCGFVIESLISGFEIIKSHKFGLQVLGTVADISIDQCDEGNIYLGQESIDNDAQIYSSSTTALNINIPKDDDYVELAAPEQFKHSIKGGKLVTEVLEHVA